MKDVSISQEWETAARTVSGQGGIIVVVGVPDSGKSTLSRYLVHHLTQSDRTVALIDCDVGQTHLGPPTTMGMMIYSTQLDEPQKRAHCPSRQRRGCGDLQFDTLKPHYMRFIGATSPVGHFVETVVGTKKMADTALNEQAEFVIINMSGLILGSPGAELTLNQVDLLCPKYVLALQESSEIEHLIMYLEDQGAVSVFRLQVSEHARKRGPEERRRNREEKYRQYFKASQVLTMSLSLIGPKDYAWSQERNVQIGVLKDLLLGLCDSDNYLLALGILQDFDLERRCMHVLSPMTQDDLDKVRTIRLGEIKIIPEGHGKYVEAPMGAKRQKG